MVRLPALSILLVLAMLAPTVTSRAAEPEPDRGWAGADLDGARKLAEREHRPVLVLLRKPRCRPCDQLEQLLKHDPVIAPLTEPYIRVQADITEPDGKTVGWNLRARVVPAVILLGPEGLEATRRERNVERTWLVEQLQMVVYRHALGRTPPRPDEAALMAGMSRLRHWGDREGIQRLVDRLEQPQPDAQPVAAPHLFDPNRDTIQTPQDVHAFLDRVDDPSDIRTAAFGLALDLERQNRVALALHVMQAAMNRLGPDPITMARAGFLASRHDLYLEKTREQLMEARKQAPDSIPQLMALARVAERSGRIFQAWHIVEAARVYAPDDAWVAIELQRLELLTHLRSRKAPVRRPT